jgi:hypothetical protein
MLTQLFGAILHAYRNATQLNSKWYKVSVLGLKASAYVSIRQHNATQLNSKWYKVRRCSDELLLYLLALLVQKYKY